MLWREFIHHWKTVLRTILPVLNLFFSTPWCSPAPWGWAAMVSGVWGDAPSASGVAVPCGWGLGKSSSLIFWPSWEGCRGLCSWLWHRRQELRLESKLRWIKCWRGGLVPTKPSRPPLSSSWLRLQPRLRWMAFQGSPASHHCFSLYSCSLVAPSGLASCICFLMQIQQWGCVGVGREGTHWNRTSQCESGAEGEQGQRIPPWPLLPLPWELILQCTESPFPPSGENALVAQRTPTAQRCRKKGGGCTRCKDRMHSPVGGLCELDFKWEPRNMPVWLDSLQLFFFFNHKHSALLMVFHNFKTPLPWLPTMNNLAGSLGFVQGAIPSVLPLALSPVVGQSGKILCKSPPLGRWCLAQLWFFPSSLSEWEQLQRRQHPSPANWRLYPPPGQPLPDSLSLPCHSRDEFVLPSLY